MSWEDQVRQYHGYFGHGTTAKTLKPGEQEGDRFGPNGLIRRIVAVAASLVAAAPRRERGWVERVHDAESHARLAYLMNAWIGGDALSQAQFSRLFFDRAPDSKLALNFRLAAHGAEYAKNSADIRAAAERLAAAMQEVGAYHWLKFIKRRDRSCRLTENGS